MRREQVLRDLAGERAHRVVRQLAHERHEDVQAGLARSLTRLSSFIGSSSAFSSKATVLP
jgi:hypothetical protein